MSMPDVLIAADSTVSTVSRRESLPKSSAPPDSKYRDQLARTLKAPPRTGEPAEAQSKVPSGSPEGAEVITTSVPQKSPAPVNRQAAEVTQHRATPAKITATDVEGQQPTGTQASTLSNFPAVATQTANVDASSVDALVFEVASNIDTEPAEDDVVVSQDGAFEIQAVQGAPPAHLQLLALNPTTISIEPAPETNVKPPEGLKVVINATATHAATVNVPAYNTEAIEQSATNCPPSSVPQVPAGFVNALAEKTFTVNSTQQPFNGFATPKVVDGFEVIEPVAETVDVTTAPDATNSGDALASREVPPVGVPAQTATEPLPSQFVDGSDTAPKPSVNPGFAVPPVVANTSKDDVEAEVQEVAPRPEQTDTAKTKQTKTDPRSAAKNFDEVAPHARPKLSLISPQAMAPSASVDASIVDVPNVATTSDDVDETAETQTVTLTEGSVDVAAGRRQTETFATGTHTRVSSELSNSDPTEFVDRLAGALRQSHDSGRQLKIRLNPPELGSLQIEVSLRDGAVSARLEVQNAAAHQTIVDNLATLREALAQHGAGIDRVDVQVVRQPSDENNARSGKDQSQQFQQQSSNSREQPRQQQQEPREQAKPAKRNVSTAPTLQLDELDIQI